MTYRLAIECHCNKRVCDDSRYIEQYTRGLALTQAIGAPMGAVPPIATNNPQNAGLQNQTGPKERHNANGCFL